MLVEQTRPDSKIVPRPPADRMNLNVLVIDDDPADTALAVSALGRLEEVAAVETRDSADLALRELQSGALRPDVIFLDLRMPGTDGAQFLRALEDNSRLRDIPTVVLTTSRMKQDMERCRTRNACGYIVKPDSIREWRERIEATVWRAVLGRWA